MNEFEPDEIPDFGMVPTCCHCRCVLLPRELNVCEACSEERSSRWELVEMAARRFMEMVKQGKI